MAFLEGVLQGLPRGEVSEKRGMEVRPSHTALPSEGLKSAPKSFVFLKTSVQGNETFFRQSLLHCLPVSNPLIFVSTSIGTCPIYFIR